jgi:hypothetical protein
MKIPQPRKSYPFDTMAVGEVFSVKITAEDVRAGARALCAAYAYGRRNGQRYCGASRTARSGVKYLDISRWA